MWPERGFKKRILEKKEMQMMEWAFCKVKKLGWWKINWDEKAWTWLDIYFARLEYNHMEHLVKKRRKVKPDK